jgi:hypothetical protein
MGSGAPRENCHAAVVLSSTARSPDRYLLGSYRIATAPEPNSSRLTSFKSMIFESPANSVGPWPALRGRHVHPLQLSPR